MKKQNADVGSLRGRERTQQIACDIAAGTIFVLFALLFVSSAKFGVQNADESAYYTFCHRLLFGDAPVVNEWSMTQFSFVFQYLPFRLFYAAAGGTEGCILFLRYFFIAVRMLLFAAIYLILRKKRFWGLAGAVIFTGFLPSGMMTLSYYNIAPAAALLAGLLLFVPDAPKPAAYVAAGFAFACAVICAPASAAIWLVFSLLALLAALLGKRNKKPFASLGGLTDGRSWLLVTAGVALCAAIYLGVLFVSGGVKPVIEAIPELLRDKTFSSDGMSFLEKIKWEKFLRFFRLFGVPSLVLNALYLIGAPLIKKYLPKYRAVYLSAGCALLVFTVVVFHVRSVELNHLGEIIYRPLLFCAPGLAAYLLTKKKNPRLLAFFLFGCANSVCTDLPSNISFGGACVVADVPAMLMIGALIGELRQNAGAPDASKTKTIAEKTSAAPALLPLLCAAAILLTLASSEIYSGYLTRTRPTLESFNFRLTSDDLTQTVDRGPLKGLRTSPQLKSMCENAMDDLDAIGKDTEKPFYTADFCPWFYLYAELPYGTYSTSYVEADSRDRLLRYWEKHPEATPEYVYIPSFNCDNYHGNDEAATKEKLAWFASVFEYEATRGSAGYILKLGGRK